MATLLGGAIVLGGGGSPTPGPELLLELIAAGCAAAMIVGPARMTAVPASTRTVWIVAGLVLLLPALQLAPLPAGMWHSLPGRELEVQSLSLTGDDATWRPWSLFPHRTLAGLLAAVPPVILMLAVSRLDPLSHRRLLAMVMIGGFASVALGAIQLSGGLTSAFRIYSQSNPGYLNGFQANRNAEADVILIAIVAVSALSAAARPAGTLARPRWLVSLGLGLLALGLVLTGSRAGIALLLPVGALALALVFGLPRRPLAAIAAVSAAAIAAFALLQHNPAIQRVLGRFGLVVADDSRAQLWSDAIFAIKEFWPVGAGIGAAAPILTAVERLDLVDLTHPNRVHNDFLELVLETGVFGPLVLLAIAALLARAAVLHLRDNDAQIRVIGVAALAILGIIAIHSIVDYPLRSMSLAHLAGLAAGMILSRREGRSPVAGNGGTA
ncbi:MAG: O-antigen ligase family protein [Tsuneonella sp.]